MPIQGSLAEAGLPDVLQLLALGRKTGCLSMLDGAMHGEIYLDQGRISYATVANRLDRLGEVLVKSGRITREQLQEATEAQARGSKEQIGKILVTSGHIERAELERWVGLQVEEAVYFLFTWRQGTFTFTADRRPPHEPLPVPLEAEGLLLEGARRVDEWSQIEKKIPSFDLIYRRSKDRSGATVPSELTYPQQRILPLLDGTRDVTGLVDATGLGEFDVGKALYGLVTAGLAQLVERRAHVRHLDYRELLAYVVREAEFADPQRRKDAGRHIVDCPTCADRLRTIQVRRTEGSGTFRAVEPDLFVEAASAPAASPPQPAAAVVLPGGGPQMVERRAGNRRSGRDRRQFERRAGMDRRQNVNPSWGSDHEERRMGPRRADDWVAARRRRSSDAERRNAAGTQNARPHAGQRHTEARLKRPFERRGGDRPIPVETTLEEELGGEAPEAAARDEQVSPAAEAAAGAPAQSRLPVSTPTYDRRKPPSPPEPGGRRTTDLAWLVSPQESVEMIRASRSAVPRQQGSSAPAAPPAEARSSVAEVRPPQPVSSPRQGSARPAAPPHEAAAPERSWAALDEAWAKREAKPTGPYVGRDPFPMRRFAAAAGLVAVVAAAYLIGEHGGRSRTGQAAQAAAGEPAPGPETAARQQPTGTRAIGPRANGRGGVQVTAHVVPPASRTPSAPAPSAPAATAARAAPVPTAAAAQPSPAPSPSPQAIAPPPAPTQPAPQQAEAPAAPAPAAVTPTRPAAIPAVNATEPDRDLAAGGWAPAERAAAVATLGGTLGAVEGLYIESISQSTAGTRTRVRVAQLTPAGERIVLTETRAGAAVRGGPGPAVVTALRVMPPSEAYPFSTGTVSLGNVLITVKSGLAADALKSLLGKLADVSQTQ